MSFIRNCKNISSKTCLLMDDDLQCGHIFYNQNSWLLKYYCTYCQETYDDIKIFCDHLSDHIHETSEKSIIMQEESESCEAYKQIEESNAIKNETPIESFTVRLTNKNKHAAQPDTAENGFTKYINCSEIIHETSTDKQDFTPGNIINEEKTKKKKKRVTTVKIIAFKNRVSELYEKISSLEAVRQEGIGSSIAGTIARCKNNNSFVQDNSESALTSMKLPTADDNAQLLSQKIIGETLITLMPNPNENSIPVPQQRPFACIACGQRFRSAFSLTVHKRTHFLESGNSIKLAHKCSDCDRLFNTIIGLKQHIKDEHFPEGFICKICGKKMGSIALLETHIKKVHLPKPFMCQQCKKTYVSLDALRLHEAAVHSSAEFIYKCKTCGRKYNTEELLREHMHRHKEAVPETCVICGKTTLRITQHMKIHAPRPKRILRCSECGKTFNYSSGLSHHFKIMHRVPSQGGKIQRDDFSNITLTLNNVDSKRKRKRRMKNVSEIDQTRMDEVGNTNAVDEEVNQKEEEAKRVIVELIQNNAFNSCMQGLSFVTDNETAPPSIVAHEEIISAINSIASDS